MRLASKSSMIIKQSCNGTWFFMWMRFSAIQIIILRWVNQTNLFFGNHFQRLNSLIWQYGDGWGIYSLNLVKERRIIIVTNTKEPQMLNIMKKILKNISNTRKIRSNGFIWKREWCIWIGGKLWPKIVCKYIWLIEEGWVGQPNGLLQVLWERGWIDERRISEYTLRGRAYQLDDNCDILPEHPTIKMLNSWCHRNTTVRRHIAILGTKRRVSSRRSSLTASHCEATRWCCLGWQFGQNSIFMSQMPEGFVFLHQI